MNNTQLALIRAIIEQAAIVEVDLAKDGGYYCNECDEPFTEYMTNEEFEEVREYLDNIVSTMPTTVNS